MPQPFASQNDHQRIPVHPGNWSESRHHCAEIIQNHLWFKRIPLRRLPHGRTRESSINPQRPLSFEKETGFKIWWFYWTVSRISIDQASCSLPLQAALSDSQADLGNLFPAKDVPRSDGLRCVVAAPSRVWAAGRAYLENFCSTSSGWKPCSKMVLCREVWPRSNSTLPREHSSVSASSSMSA